MNIKSTQSLLKLLVAAASTGLLFACGGGGSSEPAPPVSASPALLSIGTITGFGSVVINGVRFDDSAAQVKFEDGDDDSSGADNRGMKLGMNAEVKGTISDDRSSGHANEIHIESLVRGPVVKVTAAATGNGGTVEALGVKIIADDSTKFLNFVKVGDLQVNDLINVHGLLNSDGSVQAKFMEKRASTKTLKTVGTTASTDSANKKFKLGNLTVTYSDLTKLRNLPNGVSDGILVRVTALSADFDAATNTLKADKIKRVTPFEDNGMDRGEVKGTVADLSADKTSFTLNGVKVTVNSSTTYRDGTAANLMNGALVEVHGAVSNGSLLATSIEFKGASDDSDELHGTISLLTSTTTPVGFSFTVHEQKVQTDANTVYKLRSSAALANGMKVEVRGTSVVNGVLLATKVSEEDR
jgi:Domain of unknown function (DUF5666)